MLQTADTLMLYPLVLNALVLEALMLKPLVLHPTEVLDAAHVLSTNVAPAAETGVSVETAHVAAREATTSHMASTHVATAHMPATHVASATHMTATTMSATSVPASMSMGIGRYGERKDETGSNADASGANHGQDSRLKWPSEFQLNYCIHLNGQEASKFIRRLSIF
ncbi:MAG TPA: hypothetical protein VGM98_23900 [Schlesneria sp.]